MVKMNIETGYLNLIIKDCVSINDDKIIFTSNNGKINKVKCQFFIDFRLFERRMCHKRV